MGKEPEKEKTVGRTAAFVDFLQAPDGLHLNQFNIMTGPMVITDPTKPEGGQQRGVDWFIQAPSDLFNLVRGTIISPDDFVRQLSGVDDLSKSRALTSRQVAVSSPVFQYQSENLDLTVFHGSNNFHAEDIKDKARCGTGNPITRADYQESVICQMFPIIRKPVAATAPVWIREDCLATAESVLTTLALLDEQGIAIGSGPIRIDVLTATHQGILILNKFARENNLKLELNVGNTAPGLTAGQPLSDKPNVFAHACYITGEDGMSMTVGDIGDAGKSLPLGFDDRYPWNSERAHDNHGSRGNKVVNLPVTLDPVKRTDVSLFRGGYFMESLYRCVLNNQLAGDRAVNQFRIHASRTYDGNQAGVAYFWEPRNGSTA